MAATPLDRDAALRQIPAAGFLRVSRKELPGPERSSLIRKGNELFNQKRFDLAERIFVTTHYSDGLRRLGQLYEEQDRLMDALRMYYLAPDRPRIEQLTEQFAGILRKWLKDDGGPYV